ncbi:hypothetical protein [Moorena sp. SIO3I6]|uniref:hypothetical protein n=1 Tax=Moorena sp. SIO3I6 TaxID=2607831 RepID=UPI0013F798B2|nr:hypothetical protein [Moorena sp. SIO3I6]NEP28883.1 hypothetical protein [Moorena sp. SIO3I6]
MREISSREAIVLKGRWLSGEYLSKLMIIVAIAYTSAILQGRHIKRMGIQKYVVRPETQSSGQRQHSGATQGRFTRPLESAPSAFYVGLHQHSWLFLRGLCQKIVDEMHGN